MHFSRPFHDCQSNSRLKIAFGEKWPTVYVPSVSVTMGNFFYDHGK